MNPQLYNWREEEVIFLTWHKYYINCVGAIDQKIKEGILCVISKKYLPSLWRDWQ